MEGDSPTHSYPNPDQESDRPSPHLGFPSPSYQTPTLGYAPNAQPALDSPLESLHSFGEQSTTSFLTDAICWRREGSGADRGFPHMSCSFSEEDACHLDGAGVLGEHFADTRYYANKKEDVWGGRGDFEAAANGFYGKDDNYSYTDDVFHSGTCVAEDSSDAGGGFSIVYQDGRNKENTNGYVNISCKAEDELLCTKDTIVGGYAKHNSLYNRDAAVIFNDGSSANENLGSSRSSSEDQSPQAPLSEYMKPGTWVIHAASSQAPEHGECTWRSGLDSQSMALLHKPLIGGGEYSQKLDSFSEAFLSYRKRGFTTVPGGDSAGPFWTPGPGREECAELLKSNQSCLFSSTSDSYVPLASSPSRPHLPSFSCLPSLRSLCSPPPPPPPFASHLMPPVLSPPPMPLPPMPLSPSKMDPTGELGGAGYSALNEAEPLGTLQYFPSPLQSPMSSVHPCRMLWKLPLMPHCFTEQSGDLMCDLRSNHGNEFGSPPDHDDVSHTPGSSSLHPSGSPLALNSPSLHHPSLRPAPRLPHPGSLHHKEGESLFPHAAPPEVRSRPPYRSCSKNRTSPVYTGTPFPSVLHSRGDQGRGHYVPPPILDPCRRGGGLYVSVASVAQEGVQGEEQDEGCGVVPCINIGPSFQAELPPCLPRSEVFHLKEEEDDEEEGEEEEEEEEGEEEEEPGREQLLWKPWTQLEENAGWRGQVARLLSVCTSSCLPGGGVNTELTLHCLHHCQGDTMATLEMLLFSQPSPAGDYHYSGSDVWTECERDLFNTSLVIDGKDFSLIQKRLWKKSVHQCVEFYYLHSKLLNKQRKQRGEEEDVSVDRQVVPVPRPINAQFELKGSVPVPPLASFFPCKMCGKMFYKIKSRNAHMKIHRQPQEDWSDRRLLTQSLVLGAPRNLAPNLGRGLLQPKTSSLAYTSTVTALSSGGGGGAHSSGTLDPFAANRSTSAAHGGDACVRNNGAAATFGDAGRPNPCEMTRGEASDTGKNQRGPPPTYLSTIPGGCLDSALIPRPYCVSRK